MVVSLQNAPRIGAAALAACLLAACSNSSVQSPGGGAAGTPSVGIPGGLPGGLPGSSGSGMPGGLPGAQSGAGAPPGGGATSAGSPPGGSASTGANSSGGAGGMPNTGGGGDPADVFDKSLGDFDGEIARERDSMASAGKGSSRGAQSREAGDASAVKQAGERSGGSGKAGGGQAGGAGKSAGEDSGGAPGGMDGSGPADMPAPSESTEEGGGKTKPGTSSGPKDATGSQGSGPVAPIPDDIPTGGNGEDDVAKQIREAAEAEQDPKVREALWNEYRRYTGISK